MRRGGPGKISGKNLILDGAGWHDSHDLTVPDTISLLPLPP